MTQLRLVGIIEVSQRLYVNERNVLWKGSKRRLAYRGNKFGNVVNGA